MMCIFSYVGSWHSVCKLFAISNFLRKSETAERQDSGTKGSSGVPLLDMGGGRCFGDPHFSSGRGIRNEHSYKYTLNAPWHEGIFISYRKPGNRSREGMTIRHPAGPRFRGSSYGHQGEGLAWQLLVLSRGQTVLDPPRDFPIHLYFCFSWKVWCKV